MDSENELEYGQALDSGLLIELVQGYSHLYDLANRDYKNTTKKEESWKEISQMMGASVPELKKHWKNLRDKFMREKREKPSGSGCGESQWKFFQKMEFYGRCCRPRRTSTATPKLKDSKPSSRPSSSLGSSCSESNVWNTMETIMSPLTETEAEQDTEVEAPATSEPQSCLDTKRTPTSTGVKRKSVDPDCAEMVQAAKKIAEAISGSRNTKAPTQNETFTQYILTRLNSMDETEAKQKRKKMLLILEDIE